MAYHELASGRPLKEILGAKTPEPIARSHFWDGEALGRRFWLFSALGPILAILCYWIGLVVLAALAFSILHFSGLAGEPVAGSEINDEIMQTLLSETGLWGLAFLFGAIALLIPFVWGGARWVQNWGFGAMISMVGRIRWVLLGKATLAAVLTWLVMGVIDLGLGFWVERRMPTFHGFSSSWVWTLLFIVPIVVLQSSAEELFFRGYLPQSLHHILPKILKSKAGIAVLTSGLFAAIHWGNPDVMHAPWHAMAEFFVLSLAICWLTLRLGGLEAAFALHSINNAMLILVFSAEQYALGDQVLFTVAADGDFGTQWWHWLVQWVHLFLTCCVFWIVGLWRRSPVSLAVEVDRQRQQPTRLTDAAGKDVLAAVVRQQ